MRFCAVLGLFCVLCLSRGLCQDKKFAAPVQNAIDITDKRPPSITTSPVAKQLNEQRKLKEAAIKVPPLIKVCPGKDVPRPFFSLPCTTTTNCAILGPGLLCCGGRCLKGVAPPKIESRHEPILFGLVDRKCPADPIPELFEIKKCETDNDCLPRICCPEKLRNGENVSFCRTAQPIWDKLPLAKQMMQPLRTLVSYLQCTPPPPPVLDLFPKPCDNPLDCFPNLCCQEGDKKYCRPPKRSILALVAGIGQRLVPSDAARAFIERIS